MNELPVKQARQMLESASEPLQPLRPAELIRELEAEVSPGVALKLRHIAGSSERPSHLEPRGVLVYFHGGGWVVGSRLTHDAYCQDLAQHTGLQVVSVEYRLAPEHRFPTAAEDCYAATRWVAEHREEILGEIDGDSDLLVVAGDSAGGNLAAVTTLLARERGGPQIDGQILIYPITDCRFDRSSYQANAQGYHLSRDMMRWFWEQYAPDARDRQHWIASPLRAEDHRQLPPALVMTAEFDPLCDEGEEYAARLTEAGVPTSLKRYDGMIHGFVRRTEWPAAREALKDVADAISRFRKPTT